MSLVCAFKKAIKNLEVKVDLQKGASRLENCFDKRCASFM